MTHKKGAKLQPPFKLDMPFGKALAAFILTDPKEVESSVDRAKQKKPPGSKRKKPPGEKPKNVVSLKARRERKRNYGR